MTRKDGHSASLQQHGTSRETRSSTKESILKKESFLQSSHSCDKHQGRDDYVKPVSSNTANSTTIDSGSDSEGNGDDSGTNTEEEDNSDGDDEQPESVAPSESSKKRGHQTGLSVSLSNTTLVNDANSRKRTRSTESDEDGLPSRMKKGQKSFHDSDMLETIEDDDNYDAVDLISESDDEDDIEREEEKVIIDSEEENGKIKVGKRHRSRSRSGEAWSGFSQDTTSADAPFFDEHFGRTERYSGFELYSPSHLEIDKVSSEARTPQKRRVRFVDEVPQSSSSSSTSTTSEIGTELFPDLFLQQDRLDPSFRQLIENDNEDGERSMTDGKGSYWDLDRNGDGERLPEVYELGDESSSSEGSSSGYESDMGETTDEEVLPPVTINHPQSLLRLNASSSHINATRTPASTPIRRPSTMNPSRPRGPSMGSWVADPTKPIAVVDKTGKNIIFYPAKRPLPQVTAQASSNSSTLNSPTTSLGRLANAFEDSENDRSDETSRGFPNSLLPAADLMMSGLFNGPSVNDFFMHPGQVVGPPQAFYSLGSFGPGDEDEDYSDDDCENELNMDDFIDFGDTTSDSEAVASEDNDEPAITDNPTPNETPVPTPVQTPIRAEPRKEIHKSSSEGLLEHFDRGVVSSFRRNQNRHQNLLRRPPNNTNVLVIKGGRHIAANSPISPLRKRKTNQSFGGPLSPFAGVAAKRRINYINPKKKKKLIR